MTEECTTPDLTVLEQRVVEAVNARDIDAILSLFAPDAVFEISGTFAVFEGRVAIRGFAEDWLGAYDEFEMDLEEIRLLGHGVTFVAWVQRGRPVGSTRWVQIRRASVGTWVDGLIQRSTNSTDIDEARAAAERLAQELG
jgi:uncharacterized protein (TIGR02246 family)